MCDVIERKTPTSSPFLSTSAAEVWPLACAAVLLCLKSGGKDGKKHSFPLNTKQRTGRHSWSSVSSLLLMLVRFTLRPKWEPCPHWGQSWCCSVHTQGLEKCLCPVSLEFHFGTSFIEAPACCLNTDTFLGFLPKASSLNLPPWAGIGRAIFLFLLLMFKHDPVLQFMKSKLWIPTPLRFCTSCLHLWDNMPGKLYMDLWNHSLTGLC